MVTPPPPLSTASSGSPHFPATQSGLQRGNPVNIFVRSCPPQPNPPTAPTSLGVKPQPPAVAHQPHGTWGPLASLIPAPLLSLGVLQLRCLSGSSSSKLDMLLPPILCICCSLEPFSPRELPGHSLTSSKSVQVTFPDHPLQYGSLPSLSPSCALSFLLSLPYN